MRPYILAENSWQQVKETEFSIAILPWGATEAHNYHLPYSTDVIEAENFAAESAKIAWDKGCKDCSSCHSFRSEHGASRHHTQHQSQSKHSAAYLEGHCGNIGTTWNS